MTNEVTEPTPQPEPLPNPNEPAPGPEEGEGEKYEGGEIPPAEEPAEQSGD